MSDTPRTDVAEFWFRPADRTLCKYDGKVVYAIVSKTLERELATTQAALESTRKTLCFFASVIKSGESWSSTCEKEFNDALSTPTTNADKKTEL